MVIMWFVFIRSILYCPKIYIIDSINIICCIETFKITVKENECQNKINDFFMSAIESAANNEDEKAVETV